MFCWFSFYLSIKVCSSLPGKFGAVLASIPLPIIAAIYCVLYAYVGMCVIYWFMWQMQWKLCNVRKIILQYNLYVYMHFVKTNKLCVQMQWKLCNFWKIILQYNLYVYMHFVKSNKLCKMYFHLDHANFMYYSWNVTIVFLWWAASAGLGFLQFCNLNSYRSMFIVGFSLFMGLSVPQYFNEYVLLSGHGPVHTGTTAVCIYYLKKSYLDSFFDTTIFHSYGSL